jgi:dTDP-4-dehydrorhamnose reductase
MIFSNINYDRKKNYKYPRILLIGGSGQLGHELKISLQPLGKIWSPKKKIFDLSKPEMLRKVIQEYEPHLIVNAAAFTNVELANVESTLAYKVNSHSPRILAEEAHKLNIPLVHYSTDYVFDGEKEKPYTENDDVNPLNVYGKSKLIGEQEIQLRHDKYLILRTSWLYSEGHGRNFYRTMLKLFREKKKVEVINDQFGNPTSVNFLAYSTFEIISKLQQGNMKENRWGIYHLAAEEKMTWYDFAQKIYIKERDEKIFLVQSIEPISSAEYPSKVIRPKNSSLNCDYVQKKFGDVYKKNFYDKSKKTTKLPFLLYFYFLKILLPLFILFFPSYISTFLDFGRRNRRLPKRSERISKKDNVLDEFNFFNFDSLKFDEINIVMKGGIKKINDFSLPTFFVNSYKPLPSKFINPYCISSDRLIFKAMMGKPENEFYKRFTLNNKYKKLYVMPLIKLVNKLKKCNYSTTEDSKKLEELVRKYKKDIDFDGKYNSLICTHPFKGTNIQIGSGILCVIAMLNISKKVNVYGWDAFLNDDFPRGFWSQTMRLWSNFNEFHPGSRFAAIVLNWIYAYRLINEFDSKRLTVNGNVRRISKLNWVEKYLFKIIYK